jgi:arylsulfate sulfotransferase
MRTARRGWVVVLGLGCLPPLGATISNVHLGASPASPQLLGTSIKLTASAKDSDPGPVTYRWEVQAPGATSFSIMRDFDLGATFTWTPNYTEGAYQLRLTARDYLAGTSAQTVVNFQVNPLVTGSQAVVVPTANPLVALLSAPPCAAGSTMRVVFEESGVAGAAKSFTDWRSCHPGSMNFYIAGMLANQAYQMNYQVQTGGKTFTSSALTFTTGSIPPSLKIPPASVLVPIPGGNPDHADTNSRLVVMGYAEPPYIPAAVDLSDPPNTVWYYNSPGAQFTRPVSGGTWLAIETGLGTGTGVWYPAVFTRQQILREFDLAGNTIRETNCDRVMEQLMAMGMTDPLGRFNHDAIRISLPGNPLDGYTITLGDVQRIFPAGTEGSAGPIDIIGAIVIVLDQNFQVAGYWNAFDHDCLSSSACLSIQRLAIGNTTCVISNGAIPPSCPPALLSSPANDWLHANSIQFLTQDGDLLVSMRDQDWVVKIDYQSGAAGASNGILWRLGNEGDFTLTNPPPGDPFPWFSGPHNPGFVGNTQSTFAVFDNGTSRVPKYGGDSRGQVYSIDEVNLTATLTLDADLGLYSYALGSAQALLNGDYLFVPGRPTINGVVSSQSTEVNASGVINYQLQAPSITYRGWRLTDFYNIPDNGDNGPE